MLSLFMTACSSDDYDWATVTGNQVYFSSELDSIMEISTKATTFEVPISRVNAFDGNFCRLKAKYSSFNSLIEYTPLFIILNFPSEYQSTIV